MGVKKYIVKGIDKTAEKQKMETVYKVLWDGRAAIIQGMDDNFKWVQRVSIAPIRNKYYSTRTQYVYSEWWPNPYNRQYIHKSENTYSELNTVYKRLKMEIEIELPNEIKEHLDAFHTMQLLSHQN